MKKFKFERLLWDSEFFGYEVVRLNLNDCDHPISLKAVRDQMQEEKVCYVFSPVPAHNDIGAFEDEKVVLERKLIDVDITTAQEYASATQADFNKLLPLAYASGALSRFQLDKNFNQREFERLYEIWLAKSLSREFADEVLHVSQQGRSLGFITLKQKTEVIEIGLMATDENRRGQGIGKGLIDACVDYAYQKQCLIIRVPTQRRNMGAINFYNKNKFHEVENTHIYHVWK